MNKDDKALLRQLAWQLFGMAAMKAPKAERYEEAANACDKVSARLRERAEEARAGRTQAPTG